ncbi:MAG: MOSC domain-containing protein [Polyangiaceae bacterium]|nr:MOSC domain-containing protein [Polyangiaceae bacterium]
MKVSALFRYPIKSCRGVEVSEADISLRGLFADRRWMVTDLNGKFLSQRDTRALGKVRAQIVESGLAPQLVVTAEGAPPLSRPWCPEDAQNQLNVTVWGSACTALEDPELSYWFSEVLDRKVRAVFQPDDSRRDIDDPGVRPGEHVSFADTYPVLLTSDASLADLNSRLEEPISQARFRPNIVIDGEGAFEEDGYRLLAIGGCRFRMLKLCDRCVVTTIDPDTLQSGREPLATLSTFRRVNNKVCFGVNLVPELMTANQSRRIAVGDPVVIEERRGARA